MSDSCKCFDIEVEVILDEPEFDGELDFDGEVITCSDGEDYKRGYEEGHAQGLIDGRADGYQSGYDEGHEVGSEAGYSQGKQDGLTEGYDNGYEKGKQDGYEQGYSEGYTKGYEQGKTEAGGYEWVEDNSEVVYEPRCYGGGQGISLYVTENGTGIYRDNGIHQDRYFTPQWAYENFNQIAFYHGINTPKVIGIKQVEVVEDERVTTLGKNLFACMKNLKIVKLPQNILSIDNNCFAGCQSLKKVELPESVNSIGSSAFRECFSLESFNIPNLVTSLEAYTFNACSSLKTVDGIERLESIGTNCFDGCVELQGSITFNAKLQSLLESVFRNCFGITEFIFLGVPEQIKKSAFTNCVNVTNFSIPQGWNIDLYLNSMLNLNEECVQNITDNIADLTGLEGKIIQFHADVKAKLTEEQIATITGKNWTLA